METEAEEKILDLLSEGGWSSPEVTGVKLLDNPFQSDDPNMLRSYKSATERDGGIILCSEPIRDE